MAAELNAVLVSTAWVEAHLEDERVRIVEVDEHLAPYAEAHIPGAIGLDWRRDLQDPLRRDFLGPEPFARLFGSLGVGSEHTIVLYGDRDNRFAASAYWYLRYYGHRELRLMDGPREKWMAEGRAVTAARPGHAPAAFVPEAGDDAIRARRGDVLAALLDGTALVDARSTAEHAGELLALPGHEHEGGQRAGRIPGACSVPWGETLAPDGTFKRAGDLRALFRERGVADGAPVIAYCRIGERSAHTWFVLHELLGREDVRNYDGSWSEWGNLVNVPVERGA
jgi:thiosulfate/3-mercaptopyruvate sulfurtransferase